MNPITACCAAVLMLGLAACGDSKKTPAMMPDPDPTPMATAVPLATLQGGYVAAPGTYRVTGDDAALMGLLTALRRVMVPDDGYEAGDDAVTAGGLMLQCSPESTSNCNMSIDDDGVITVTGTIRVAAVDGMFPQTAEERMAAAEAARTAAIKQAESKEAAIGVEAAQTPDDGPGGGDASTDHAVAIERSATETTVTITVDGAAATAPKFAPASGTLTPVSPTHGRTMLVRTMPKDADDNVVEEVMIVATDIAAPKPVAFADWVANLAGDTPHDLTVRRDGESVDTDNPADSMRVETGTNNANLPLIMAAAFARPPQGSSRVTHTFLPAAEDIDPDTPGNQSRAAATADGTYRGADGTYTCSESADCTVTVNAMGAVTGIGGAWIFTPDSGATSDQPDHEYLRYGFWLERNTDKDGAVTYNEVETFADSTAARTTDVNAVTGSATYEGGAVGVYAISTAFDPNTGERLGAGSGHFRATASLTATFSQTAAQDIAPNKLNKLTGTIDQFVLSGGETNTWAVKLDGAITANDATASGDALVGDEDAGSFSANFHGPNTVDGNATAPHSVVGEFNANFTNGTVAGAFGATEKDD